jgi:hypothetical protein
MLRPLHLHQPNTIRFSLRTNTALEELWTLEIQPGILVDPSITISHTARKLIRGITPELRYQDCLLLCCIRWEFNANQDVDSWGVLL